MNDVDIHSPALKTDGHPPGDEGWSWRKIFFLIAFAFAAHLALIFFFGTKKLTVPRAVAHVPHLQFVREDNEFIALNNPALFALPNPRDFSSVIWTQIPGIAAPQFNWTEPPQWLPLSLENLGVTFRQFMQTNRLAAIQLSLKPQPELAAPYEPDISAMPQSSQLKLIGPLAQRGLRQPAYLPAQFVNDVIPPSKVQVLVDPAGAVVSAVLLPSDNPILAAEHNARADQQALTIARQLRFRSAHQLTLGEIFFIWHTLPDTLNNSSATP
ncbi:MAG TPA: hypothetical protein VGO57_06655 [Verrucomicrobiae bacterium]|jgi:hypothetical protein